MSFATYKDIIEDQDVAIVYRRHDDIFPMTIRCGEFLNDKDGSYKHDDFIGQPWGSKFASHTGKGFIILLHPTPELWTLALPHRTQILYIADISYITAKLRIRPGSVVVESGTGSGSFSHSLIRTIAPSGHLYTFEYHEDRAKAAKEEFFQHGLSQYVTGQCRDVCRDGFGLSEIADAVFLDLPAPWEAIPSAHQALKKNLEARIACFSPCIEQVMRTVEAMRRHGFTGIEMFECLLREHDVRKITIRSVDAGRSKLNKKLGPVEETSLAEMTMTAKYKNMARGHTSYLTFASLLPSTSSN